MHMKKNTLARFVLLLAPLVSLLASASLRSVAAETSDSLTQDRALEARKTNLQSEYYRLISIQPAAARKCRDEYAALVNQTPAQAPFFSYVLGAQWLGGLPAEQELAPFLKGKAPLPEACRIIGELGSDIIKIAPGSKQLKDQGFDVTGYETLDKAIRHPHFKRILDLPYRVMLFWAHGSSGSSSKPMSEQQKADLHREFFELTKYLLTQYNDTGKTFLIGNWEGDWMAGAKSVGNDKDLDEARIRAFQEWLDVRTSAIDKAKAMTPHWNVAVYSYLEINLVNRARTKRVKRLVNTVLPLSHVDYVSVSSYETQGYGVWEDPKSEAALHAKAFDNLNYIESNLPPRDIPGKRVFIGEIGFTLEEIQKKQQLTREQADKEQARLALVQAKVDLEWGTPLWLWWAIFNSREGSFSLVNQLTGQKSALYDELKIYYQWADDYVKGYKQAHGTLPDQATFRRQALEQLSKQISRLS